MHASNVSSAAGVDSVPNVTVIRSGARTRDVVGTRTPVGSDVTGATDAHVCPATVIFWNCTYELPVTSTGDVVVRLSELPPVVGPDETLRVAPATTVSTVALVCAVSSSVTAVGAVMS